MHLEGHDDPANKNADSFVEQTRHHSQPSCEYNTSSAIIEPWIPSSSRAQPISTQRSFLNQTPQHGEFRHANDLRSRVIKSWTPTHSQQNNVELRNQRITANYDRQVKCFIMINNDWNISKCATCGNLLINLCTTCSVKDTLPEHCLVDQGVCKHAFHRHCLKLWFDLQIIRICPVDYRVWQIQD
uniref:Zinc finger RING-H2-type domain-containing protein n=1 Tax=Panagrolaimus davidi TaxID=227884 RepID=A0A914PCD9_9BILA